MGINVGGTHVPGWKKDPRACRWSLAAGRRLGVAGIAAAVLGVAACSSASPSASATSPSQSQTPVASSSTPPPSAVPSSGAAGALEQQYEQVVSKVLPSVVQISTTEGSGSG